MDECKGHIIDGYIVQENGIVRDSEHKIVGRLNDLNRIAELKDKIEDRDKILKKANIFVNDVMPQIGGLTIQDFANLNELCMGLTNLGYESK